MYDEEDHDAFNNACDALGITPRHGLTAVGCTTTDRALANIAYRKKLMVIHTDKGGSGNTEAFMELRSHWKTIDGYSQDYKAQLGEAEDLTQEDESEDERENASEDMSEDESASEDASESKKEVEAEEDARESENAEEDARESENEDEAETDPSPGQERLLMALGQPSGVDVGGSTEDEMVGRAVKHKFWFSGEVMWISYIDIDRTHWLNSNRKRGTPMVKVTTIFRVKYDDKDEEDLELNELLPLPKDKSCQVKILNPGYKFYKEFAIDGKVLKARELANGENGKSIICLYNVRSTESIFFYITSNFVKL